MTESNRGEEPRHLGGFGIAVALILSAIIAGGIAYSSGIESERRNQNPAKYSGYAKAQADRACVGLDSATLFECIYNEVESSQETARAEQDLDAQQGMKFWALWMFFATIVTAGVTLLGVYYVRLTLDKNSQLLAESARATKAMRKANKIARKSSERQIRAYVAAIKATISVKAIAGVRRDFVDIVINNKGNTPAKLTKIVVYVAHKEGLENTIIFKKTAPLQTGLSGQSGNATIPVCINQVPEKDIYLGEFEKGIFIIGGSIQYTDIFNKLRSIQFTFSTVDSFWKEYPDDAHECTILDQGFEAA